MTTRKPTAMTFESFVERQIREAQERGEFDDLPGAGKPIADLDKPHDEMWWARSLMRREGLGYLPPTLALKRDVEQGIELALRSRTESALRRAIKLLNRQICEANRLPSEGPPGSVAPLDAEQFVRRWRRMRRRGS